MHFVLPTGYQGVFKLVEDQQSGVDITKNGLRYEFEIPPSGVLRVTTMEPFADSISLSGSYANGQTIPTDPAGARPGATVLRMRSPLTSIPVGRVVSSSYSAPLRPKVVWFMVDSVQNYPTVPSAVLETTLEESLPQAASEQPEDD